MIENLFIVDSSRVRVRIYLYLLRIGNLCMMSQNLKSTVNFSFVVALFVTLLEDIHFLLMPCMFREHLHTEVVVSFLIKYSKMREI